MSREKVLEVVLRHLADTIEELEDVEIDPARSMKDLGANSLDIVEVVSCSMRELKVKVPRSELNSLENINQLVDLLHKTVEEKAAPSTLRPSTHEVKHTSEQKTTIGANGQGINRKIPAILIIFQ